MAFRLCCAVFLYAVLIFCVPFPYGVWERKWKSIVSVPNHCRFIYFTLHLMLSVGSSQVLDTLNPKMNFLSRKGILSLCDKRSFKCTCAAILLGPDLWLYVCSFLLFLLCVCEQRWLWRDCADAQSRLSHRCLPIYAFLS